MKLTKGEKSVLQKIKRLCKDSTPEDCRECEFNRKKEPGVCVLASLPERWRL